MPHSGIIMQPSSNQIISAKRRPLFARTSWIRSVCGLSHYDLTKLAEAGEIYRVKLTAKCWLYRVSDVVRLLEGPERDAEYAADLQWLEEHA